MVSALLALSGCGGSGGGGGSGGVMQAGIGGDTVFEFDPATQTWTPKTSMPTGRGAPAAAVQGGLICVAGGSDGGFDSSALVWYDPAADI